MAKTKTSTKTKTKSKSSARAAGKPASRKAKGSTTKASGRKGPSTSSKTKPTSDKEVTIDRRRGPRRDEEQDTAKPVAPVKLERRAKVNRRRQIDPTTCERDYTENEVEFMNALDDYKRKSGRMFPTCSEVLEVVRSLGYVQLSPTELAARTPAAGPSAAAMEPAVDAEADSASDWQ